MEGRRSYSSRLLCTTILISAGISFAVAQNGGPSVIQRLRKKLLTNYDKYSRPMDTFVVKVDVDPLFIVDLDEEKHFMTLDAFVKLEWKDERLSWDKAEFDTDALHFGDHEVWQPDVTVYNSHESSIDPKVNAYVIAFPDGTLMWVPPALLSSRCFVDLKDFPNDRQTCKLLMGSWTHHGYMFDLQPYANSTIMPHFKNMNTRWNLLSKTVTREVNYYDCCKEPYIVVSFSLELQRRPPAYLQMVWGPITLCLLLTLAIFWIPPHSGEKILLGGFVILVVLSLMEYVAAQQQSPDTIKPAVAPILAALLTVLSAVLVEVMVCMNMTAYRRTSRPPQFLVNILAGTCGKMMWVNPPPSGASVHPDAPDDQVARMSPYDEWYLVAGGVDRLLFVIFVIIVIAIPKV